LLILHYVVAESSHVLARKVSDFLAFRCSFLEEVENAAKDTAAVLPVGGTTTSSPHIFLDSFIRVAVLTWKCLRTCLHRLPFPLVIQTSDNFFKKLILSSPFDFV
jgi:hypothetical protein